LNRIAVRAGITLLLAVLLLAGFVFFVCEFMIKAEEWVVFPGSPHVYNGGNIGCGTVVDRDGTLLLDLNDGRTYADSESLRKSTVHWLGDRNGSVSAPALANYSSQIVGFDRLNGIYNYAQTGGTVELTLSAKVQVAAMEALGEHNGTVAVYNYRTGQLLCAVSTSTFDPDNAPVLDESTEQDLDGIYFNRFIQGTYIPGSIFKVVTLSAILETMPELQDETFVCTGSYAIGADEITCEGAHYEQSLKSAFCNSCNCAFAQMVERLGSETLQRYVEAFQVTESIQFDGITTAAGNFDIQNAAAVGAAWAGIGQYTDQINPCAFMTFMGAVAGGGRGAQPYLVEEINLNGNRTYRAKVQTGDRLMSASTAKTVTEYLRNNVESKYGADNFPGLTVCAKTGTGEVGGEKKPNAMLAGFVTDEEYPLAFVVCVEDGGYGSTVCLPIASQVLSACKEVIYFD